MSGRGHRRLGLVLVLVALVAAPGGRPALAVSNGPGSSPGCSAGVQTDVTAATTPGQPVRITTGASVTCPTPESQGGGGFGPRTTLPAPPPVPGTDCVKQVNEPMELSLTPGGNVFLVFWPDPTFNGNGSVTPEPQDVGRVISGIGARDFFMRGGSTDFFLPFTLHGKWNATGTDCVPKDRTDPQASFTNDCQGATFAFGCLLQAASGPIDDTGLPLTALVGAINVRNQMQQRIHPGTIQTLPAEPHAGLVNMPTCFFVNGADIDGQDVRQTQTFELVLIGPPDAEGRQIFYVFRVDVTLQAVDWQFGDGSSQVEGLPAPCQGVSGAPLQFAHRYLAYSPPGGFPVTATERFGIHVSEFWADANGPHAPVDLGDLQPITVSPGPPGFVKHVVQEERVPVAG